MVVLLRDHKLVNLLINRSTVGEHSKAYLLSEAKRIANMEFEDFVKKTT